MADRKKHNPNKAKRRPKTAMKSGNSSYAKPAKKTKKPSVPKSSGGMGY